MSTNSNKKIEDQEIDLALISEKIGGFFQKLNTLLFKSIRFAVKNSIIIAILLVIGFGLGLFLDKTTKTFNHQIIVQPNFNSTDYLYSKIDLLTSKIKEGDTVFLKSIGFDESIILTKIQVKPIIDIYKFINTSSEKNFELLKLMAEDGDIKKIVEEKATSKNYTYHMISFSTKSLISAKGAINPLLKFLNTSDFYTKIQKETVNNVYLKMKANEVIINQIDGFLDGFTSKINSSTKSNSLIYYNENTQLNDAIQTKDRLISEQGLLRIELVSLDKIIKESSNTINRENTKSINGKLNLILPLLFILIFISIHFFISFYKKQAEKAYQN
jgi:hypothetical protein